MKISLQMLWGGAFNLIVAGSRNELVSFELERVSFESLTAMAYLIILGSIIAFLSYNYLLEKASTTIVASHAYINPVVAILVGALFLGERFSSPELGSSALIVISVIVIINGEWSTRFLRGFKGTMLKLKAA